MIVSKCGSITPTQPSHCRNMLGYLRERTDPLLTQCILLRNAFYKERREQALILYMMTWKDN